MGGGLPRRFRNVWRIFVDHCRQKYSRDTRKAPRREARTEGGADLVANSLGEKQSKNKRAAYVGLDAKNQQPSRVTYWHHFHGATGNADESKRIWHAHMQCSPTISDKHDPAPALNTLTFSTPR